MTLAHETTYDSSYNHSFLFIQNVDAYKKINTNLYRSKINESLEYTNSFRIYGRMEYL